MTKRKKERKLEQESRQNQKKTGNKAEKVSMPVPQFLLKVLAIFLSMILVIALTLYVIGRMPARGFWTLIIILAVLGFVVIPVMRKKFSE